MRRVLAIFLDGYEHSLAQRLMSGGEMPELSRLGASSARFLLDYGPAQRTGLAGEHVATGLSPAAAKRWSAVHFDPRTYAVWQEGARMRPFVADLKCHTVAFDMPYIDLAAAPSVRGIVSWGAHDPGVALSARPSELLAEFTDRFGAYPATPWIYGFAWPWPQICELMGSALAAGVDRRANAAHWLLTERLPDWDLALVGVSEPHSVIEGLWHGIDPDHPLRHHASAAPARAGVISVYRAVDRLIGKLAAAVPDAQIVVFAMGGMGTNRSDVASMLLLPELMYRQAFGAKLFRQPPEWTLSADGYPALSLGANSWGGRIGERFPKVLQRSSGTGDPARRSTSSIPATTYQSFWRSMPAFALPSFYDGRIRVNLIGREAQGIVSVEDYGRVLSGVESLIRACIDPATGESAVDFVEYPAPRDPREAASTQADLHVIWKGPAMCLQHPSLGRVGPVPFRRTGGHTGLHGMAYVRAGDVMAGDKGIRSAFDVVPTIIELLGLEQDRSLSGASLLSSSEGNNHYRIRYART